MSVNWIKQKISFVDRSQHPFGEKKSIPEPRIVIVNAYTLIAVIYCAASTLLFYYVVENTFLAIVHLLAVFSIITNYFILIQTKNFNRATNIILTTGTIVVVSLFATGGWANTGYLWPFAYLPFAFFLSDRSTVINWVMALFGGCLVVVVVHFTGAITIPYSPAALVNYFAALLVFILCIFLFQKATVKREEFLSYTETLLEAAPDAVIVINDEGRIVKWNQKSEMLFGWTATEVLGKLLSEIIIPNRYRTAHQKGMKHFLATGEGPVLDKTIEIQAINKNEIEFDVALSISPTIVNKKHLFIGFIRDITEKKEAEEKTKESQNVFSTLFYKSPVMKAIAEASTGKYIDVNDAFADFLEYSKEELLGKTSLQLNMIVNPEERDRTLKKIQKDGFARDIEAQVTSKDGKTRWVSTNIDRMNLNGKDCFMTAAVDITKRKVAEEKLQKLSQELEQKVLERTDEINRSEKRYRNLFENNPMPIWVIDMFSFKFLDVNEAAIRHYGYSREEFLSMNAVDIRPESEKKRFLNLNRSDNSGSYQTGIWKHRKKDNSIIYVDIIAHEIIFEGKPARLVLSNDVSERTKMEEMLKESYKEISDYKFAIDESSIVAITDQKGIIKHANDNFCKISRYPREELIGQDHRIINSGHHSKDFIRNLWATIANGKIWRGELKNRAKDGTIYWVDTTIVPFLNDQGKPYQYVAIRADITGRKLVEEENRKLNEDLELRVKQRTEEMEAFSYSVSHDLRAPLRAINGFAKILDENYSTVFDIEAKRLFNRIEENAKKMGALIDDLLEFSKLGRKEIHKSPVKMTELVEDILLEINTTINHKAAIKIHRLHPANADSTMIKQVVINLLSNAIKYSAKTGKPSIEIKSHPEKGEIIYSVSDNGVGFNNQYADKLFGIFQRLHPQADFEGTGVGLALVKRIINKHGGRVWAEGELNKGATFFFSLPTINNN